MKKLGSVEKQTIEVSRHHQKIEKEKGFTPPPPLLIPEIAKLFELVAKLTIPDGQKMTYTRRATFRALEKHGVLSQQELASFAHISAPSVSIELADMEKEGLIVRKRDDHDARVLRISLTAKGKKKNEELKKADREVAAIIAKDLTAEDEKTLSALLLGVRNRLLDSLEKLDIT